MVAGSGEPRRYRSPLRAAQAAQTRSAILEAALRLFAERGWAGTSMRDVAGAAQVAVETVYACFGSKPELLRQALDVAVVGDDEPVSLAERPEFRRLATGDTRARASAAAELLTAIRRRTALLLRVLAHAASADESLAPLLAASFAAQRESIGEGASRVARRTLTGTEIDALLAVLGDEVYLTLTGVTGWTDQQYESWVAQTLIRLLDLKEDDHEED